MTQKEISLVVFFYLLMSALYFITVSIDQGRWISHWAVLLNYGLKALLTLPLLWLFFKQLASYSLWKRGLLHIVTMPIFTYAWVIAYYTLCDHFGFFRLIGSSVVWDYYLAVLFYCIQFGVFHLYVHSNQLKAQELLSAELSRLNAESELSALKAQLNPHFLYNVFNTINAAIPTTAKNARNMVTELSDLFRYQLKASREKLIPLQEELEFVGKYLELEKERFAERLQYTITTDAGIEESLIPPIIIQPLVENAIKHGISPLIEGGQIKISVKLQGKGLHFSVCDNGKGTNGKVKEELLAKGVGLSNTNERLLKMYGQGLDIKENELGGLCVYFSIPSDKA
ncbi:MAG: histidine kinase [Bacteroidota bacterium]